MHLTLPGLQRLPEVIDGLFGSLLYLNAGLKLSFAAPIYLPKDSLALTLNGTTQWPDSKVLRRLGETRMTGTPAKIREILEHISDALSQTETDVRSYIKEHPDFKEVGERMLQEWAKGRQLSLQAG